MHRQRGDTEGVALGEGVEPGEAESTRGAGPGVDHAQPIGQLGDVEAAKAFVEIHRGQANAVLRGVLMLVLAACAVTDLEGRRIPNRITAPAALLAVALGLALDTSGEPRRVLCAALAGGFLMVAALINPAGMGMGDAKLVAVMGLYLGAPVIVGLLVAMLASVATGLVIARRRGIRAARKTTLPFGPYLAFGGLVAALLGSSLLHGHL
jgi:leader peptidase (prepilin peptidase)/N-methyltransferase